MEKEKNYGLKVYDKNGKELHLHDKIKFGEHEGSVEYNFNLCCFILKWDDGTSRQITSHFAKELEII